MHCHHPSLRHPRIVHVFLCALFILLLQALLCGCGGGGGGAVPKPVSPVSLSLSPSVVVVEQGAPQAFTATVKNAADAGIIWKVQEGTAGGSITSTGMYTAPLTAGTYHVVATSRQDPSATAAASVTVPVNVAVLPAAATLSVQQSLTFTANVAGSLNQGVVWSVQEAGGGTITSAGVYTAPGQRGTYHIIATSVADTNRTGTATVTVQAGSAVGTIQ